jgi:transposase-like protein
VTSLTELPSEAVARRIVEQAILGGGRACPACRQKLKVSKTYLWCRTCRKKVRPKALTWLSHCRLNYRQLLALIWCWQQRQAPGTARLVAGVSYTAVRRWYWAFRKHLPAELQDDKLVGLVEVDEAFFGKRKYGCQTMVVGAIERDTRRLKLQVIPDREQDTLELFLTAHIARSSLVLTDYHGGYNDLEFYGYTHERCNHSKGHFGPTNQIENTWGVMKRYLRKLYGCIPTRQLQLILNEWMARHNCKQLFASPAAYLREVCSVRVD